MNKNENKGKRKVISLETKTTILKRIAGGEGSTALGKEFGLGESTIRGIQKRAGEISQSSSCATNESAKRASYSRNILIEKTEKAVILWAQELAENRIPIDGDSIKKSAIRFYNQLKDLEPSCSTSTTKSPKFSASNGWLVGFLQRHAIHNLKIKTEAAPALNYSKVLAKIIDGGGYCPDQVFNSDETGLFSKKKPSRTFVIKPEEPGSEFKAVTDRETFLPGGNASGARNFSPLTLKRSLNPRALKGEIVTEHPVHFMADVTDGQENPDYMTAEKIYTGLQLCHKLECHFLAIDANSERASKFQKKLQSCISGYQDIYKRLVKQQSSQKLITDYIVTEKKSTPIKCEIVSSDESDFKPAYHKKVCVSSDYDR